MPTSTKPTPNGIVKPKARGGRPKGSRNLGTKNAAGRAIHRHIRFKNLSQEGLVIESRSPSPQPRTSVKQSTSSLQHLTIPSAGRSYTGSLSPDPPHIGHMPPPTRYSSVDTGYVSNSSSPDSQYLPSGSHSYGNVMSFNRAQNYPSPLPNSSMPDWNHFTPNYSTSMPAANSAQCSMDSVQDYYPPPPTQGAALLSTEAEFTMSPPPDDVYANLRQEASEHWRTVLNIHHDNDVSPSPVNDLEAARDWQNHCLRMYQDSSRKVSMIEDGMMGPWPENNNSSLKRDSIDHFSIGEGMAPGGMAAVGGVAGDW